MTQSPTEIAVEKPLKLPENSLYVGGRGERGNSGK